MPDHVLRRLTTLVSDGTGLTPEQVWLVGAAAASVAAVAGTARAVDAVLNLGLRPLRLPAQAPRDHRPYRRHPRGTDRRS